MANVLLHQFSSSHFNEKARWALDYKQVDHERIGYLPGPHIPQIKKLSGQSATPVLQWGEEIIHGSGTIIEYIESKVPEHPLFPNSEDQRQQINDWCQRLDKELGPAVRTIVFASMIDHTDYLVNLFGRGKSSIKRLLYRLMLPLLKPVIAKGNGVNPENLERSEKIVDQYLEGLAEATRNTGYIVGSAFSAADLTAAALLAPLVNPAHQDMHKPEPIVPPLKAVLDKYQNHPTMTWVNQQYRAHR